MMSGGTPQYASTRIVAGTVTLGLNNSFILRYVFSCFNSLVRLLNY